MILPGRPECYFGAGVVVLPCGVEGAMGADVAPPSLAGDVGPLGVLVAGAVAATTSVPITLFFLSSFQFIGLPDAS